MLLPTGSTFPGIVELRKTVDSDSDAQKTIEELLGGPGEEPSFPFLEVPVDILPTPLLHKMKSFLTEHKNDFFDTLWLKKLRKAKENQLSYVVIREQVWEPAFEECRKMLVKVRDCSFKMSEIPKLFENKDTPVLRRHLGSLFHAFLANNEVPKDFNQKCIEQFISKVNDCLILAGYIKVAEKLLSLKASLQLEGSFKPVERLLGTVS